MPERVYVAKTRLKLDAQRDEQGNAIVDAHGFTQHVYCQPGEVIDVSGWKDRVIAAYERSGQIAEAIVIDRTGAIVVEEPAEPDTAPADEPAPAKPSGPPRFRRANAAT